MESFVIITAFSVLYLNYVATYHIFKADFFTKQQKMYQLMLVWGIAIVGSIFVIAFIFSEQAYIKKVNSQQGGWSSLRNLFFLTFFISGYSDSSTNNDLSEPAGLASHGDINSGDGSGDA